MMTSQPLFGSVSQLVETGAVGLLVLFCGILSTVSSAKGSQRFRYFFGGLIGAIMISFTSVWFLYVVGNAKVNFVRGITGGQDPAQEAMDYSILYIQSSHLVLIGLVGILFVVISLLLRKPTTGSTL